MWLLQIKCSRTAHLKPSKWVGAVLACEWNVAGKYKLQAEQFQESWNNRIIFDLL